MMRSYGFYDYAWNPVIGCKNGCHYCYAKKDVEKMGYDFETPELYEHKLKEPLDIKKPSRIFATHYCELMGEWIPGEWIEKVIQVCREASWHDFIFISKYPARYYDFVFPHNCILGVTLTNTEDWWRTDMMTSIHNRKLASIEPLMDDFTGYDFSQFEEVVIGKMMFNPLIPFNREWVDAIDHPKKYIKNTCYAR